MRIMRCEGVPGQNIPSILLENTVSARDYRIFLGRKV